MSANTKSQNPFASYQSISTIEFFSPEGSHVTNCPSHERPMLVRLGFNEVLRDAVEHPEVVMNKCGDGVVLALIMTGLPMDALPTDFMVDEEMLTLTYYQHENLEDRMLHYNVLKGHFLVLQRELHTYWKISEDSIVPDYDEDHSFRNIRKGL